MSKKVKLNLNTYSIVDRAVEEGILIGYRRAHKYISNPTEEVIMQRIVEEIMNSLSEVIKF